MSPLVALVRRLNVTIECIDYQAGSVRGKGALIWNDKVSGRRPILLAMPKWLGVTENAMKRAQKMAGEYGEGKICEGPSDLAR
jgi:hypothetical protein